MKSIPDHVLKDAVVIVPRKRGLKGIVDLNFALMVMLSGAMVAGCIFLMAVASYPSPKSISLPTWFYIVFGCIPGLALVSFSGWLAFRKSGLDVILGYDTLKGEVIIAERRFGRPRAVVPIALARVQAIRIYWEVIYIGSGTSSNPAFGCWNAQLVLSGAREIHLGHIKGKPDAPPDTWLTRFKRVSTLLDKPLQILPSFADTQQTAYTPVVDQLINNIRQQSGSPGKPPEILADSTNAEQTTYTLPPVTQDRTTVLSDIRRLYKENAGARWIVRFLVWVCCFAVSDVFTRVTVSNYWLHLLGDCVTTVFFALPFTIIFFIKPDQSEFRRDHKLAYTALTLVVYLLCLIVLVANMISLARSSYDLYHGPIYGRGVIEGTGTRGYKARRSFYIIIHDTQY